MQLKEPDEATPCHDYPAVSDLSFGSDLSGRWFVAFGLNPIYDCFPCQVFTFFADEKHREVRTVICW